MRHETLHKWTAATLLVVVLIAGACGAQQRPAGRTPGGTGVAQIPVSTVTDSPTPTRVAPAVSSTPTATPVAPPTDTPRARSTAPAATATLSPTEEVLGSTRGITLPAEHLWLARPVTAGAVATSPAPWYTFGDTLGGALRPHHGVEFPDPEGTDLTAAGTGTVVVAGDDLETAYGLHTDFYGNLVVIRLDRTYGGRLVYLLYGHMSEVYAERGDRVAPGDVIGTVGSTGIADGAHLHFEVRIGSNAYDSVRNPQLWLAPLPGTGVIAGRVLNGDGTFVDETAVNIYHADTGVLLDDVVTYLDVPRDEVLNENFALTDVPAGTYLLRTYIASAGDFYTTTATIRPGAITFVQITPAPP